MFCFSLVSLELILTLFFLFPPTQKQKINNFQYETYHRQRKKNNQTEAKFHLLVERKPLRADSEAWQRVVSSSSGSIDIPAELKAWVGEVKDESTKKDEAATLETATATAAAAAASP